MSFLVEGFARKLQGLQDTNELVTGLLQWVLFHHRHLPAIAAQWSKFILSPEAKLLKKKLTLLYLVNDVVQQARRKRRPEFAEEFAQVLPGVLEKVYAGLDHATRGKVDRILLVWEERLVYAKPAIENFKKSTKKLLSNRPDSAAVPVVATDNLKNESNSPNANQPKIAPELRHLNDLYGTLGNLSELARTHLTQFGRESNQWLPDGPLDALPLPPVYLGKLRALEKLGDLARANVREQKQLKLTIVLVLNSMVKSLLDEAGDDAKLDAIEKKLTKLNGVKKELEEMVAGDDDGSEPLATSASAPEEEEEALPTFEPLGADDSDEDELPAYVQDSDDEQAPPLRKRRALQTPLGGLTPSKKVAFSEDIEVKEFERDANESDGGEETNGGSEEQSGGDVMALLLKLT